MRPCCNYSQSRVHNRSPDRHKASGRLGPRSGWPFLINVVVRAAKTNDRTRCNAGTKTVSEPGVQCVRQLPAVAIGWTCQSLVMRLFELPSLKKPLKVQ